MFEVVTSAIVLVLEPQVLVTILLASLMGVVIGAIPGLTAVMGTALLVPVTFYLAPLPAIAAIVSMTAMAIFAGDIPGALMRIPGTPASAAYVGEAYALTRQGHPERGLGMCMGAAVCGGVMGSIVLMLAAPQLARIAMQFSTAEYFWLATLGLTSAAFVSASGPLKGMISILIGLFLSTIGIDITAGQSRYTFGIPELKGGLSYIPSLVGMFALAEILRTATAPSKSSMKVEPVRGVLRGLGRDLWRWKNNILRGGITGTLVGALPGASADIAAWVAYAIGRRTSKTPEKFGTGPSRRDCGGGSGEQRRAERCVGAHAGFRHPGGFDHGDRNWCIDPQGNGAGASDISQPARLGVRGVLLVLYREPHTVSHRLPDDPDITTGSSCSPAGADTDDSDGVHGGLIRHQ